MKSATNLQAVIIGAASLVFLGCGGSHTGQSKPLQGDKGMTGGTGLTPPTSGSGGMAGATAEPNAGERATGGIATGGLASGGRTTGGLATGGALSAGPCSPAMLAAEDLSGDGLTVEAIFAKSPPVLPAPDMDLVIRDQNTQYVVFGSIQSLSPIQLSLAGYSKPLSWGQFDCQLWEKSGVPEFEAKQFSGPTCLNPDVQAPLGLDGYYWIDGKTCCAYAFREQLTHDHVLVSASRSMFHRQSRYAFSGEILGLTADTPPSDPRDMRQRYVVRVDTAYWELGTALPNQIETEVIGWIPPKRGKLYFWGNPITSVPLVLSSYIAADPRPAWLCPTSGKYRIEISNRTKGDTICRGTSSCYTRYSVSGKIAETLQGRVATGQAVTFTMEDPPSSVVEGAVVTMVGVGERFFVD